MNCATLMEVLTARTSSGKSQGKACSASVCSNRAAAGAEELLEVRPVMLACCKQAAAV